MNFSNFGLWLALVALLIVVALLGVAWRYLERLFESSMIARLGFGVAVITVVVIVFNDEISKATACPSYTLPDLVRCINASS